MLRGERWPTYKRSWRMKRESDPYKCCVCGESPIRGGIVNTYYGNCHRTKCYPFNPALIDAIKKLEKEGNADPS